MKSTPRLADSDRSFLRELREVVFGSPYSESRAALVARLIPGSGKAPPDRLALVHVVEASLARIAPARSAHLSEFAPEDSELLEPAFLYLCYHRVLPMLDALIERQAAAAGEPLRVDFADKAIAELCGRGFPEPEALRYLAFFFQLRRAFYFIERSLAGASASMRRLRAALWNNVFTHDMRGYSQRLWNRMEDFSTLLLGETGTGKGAAAAAVGRSGFIPYLPARQRFAANFSDSFIALNLSQFPETLIEAELFGHRKGAFTGAVEEHKGVFELCDEHGALFLDEIGEASAPIQIKLLRVLQERVFTPLGGRAQKRFKGRVIAATNRSLEELRAGGRFREDFFYRLCSDVIVVPPLRERIAESPEELEQLVALLVARMAGEDGGGVLADRVIAALARDLPRGYAWPGNVRELEQAVRRILLTGKYDGALRSVPSSADERLGAELRDGTLTADELLGRYCAMLHRRHATYAEVAARTGLDRRTARKYIERYSAEKAGQRNISEDARE